MPSQILGWWLRAILTVAALAVGISLILNTRELSAPPVEIVENPTVDNIREQTTESKIAEVHRSRALRWNIGWNWKTLGLIGGIVLLVWSLGGGWISVVLFRPSDPDFPKNDQAGVVTRLARPDGSELFVECFGPPDGVPLILTHGWGLDSKEWIYTRKELANRCRIIVWDLPGLGQSKGPTNKDWSLEKLARDLEAVRQFAGKRPVILVGHSIGGMIILTFCRLFPRELSQHVAGIVLGQTTYTNPVETTSMSAVYRGLQKPLLQPLCFLMIWFAPLVWLMNCWSYCNGSVHRTNHKSFFSGQESRQQLGFISRYSVQSWPAVIARGLLGMFHFDTKPILSAISVPTLIIEGKRDTTCKPEASQHMADVIPGARKLSLVKAEHGGVFEFHQQFAESIHEFISTSLPETP